MLTTDEAPVLSVRNLRRVFPVRGAFGRRIGENRALDGVSFDLNEGEIFGIVGESGCGKSTLGKTIMGIQQPDSGEVYFEGRSVSNLSPKHAKQLRSRLQYAYQDPGASLDPRWRIGRSLEEPLVVHTDLGKKARQELVSEILRSVGLPSSHLNLYPHEISGGQQRRVGLARILMLNPKVVILDEPTSGLDVSVQATVLSLFRDLQKKFKLTYIFISHDLAVVQIMCQRVAVMYLGRIVEIGAAERIFNNPLHPYTRSLLAAIPQIGGRRVSQNFLLAGEPPDATMLPQGCRFQERCPFAEGPCLTEDPELQQHGGHGVACHHSARLKQAA